MRIAILVVCTLVTASPAAFAQERARSGAKYAWVKRVKHWKKGLLQPWHIKGNVAQLRKYSAAVDKAYRAGRPDKVADLGVLTTVDALFGLGAYQGFTQGPVWLGVISATIATIASVATLRLSHQHQSQANWEALKVAGNDRVLLRQLWPETREFMQNTIATLPRSERLNLASLARNLDRADSEPN